MGHCIFEFREQLKKKRAVREHSRRIEFCLCMRIMVGGHL